MCAPSIESLAQARDEARKAWLSAGSPRSGELFERGQAAARALAAAKRAAEEAASPTAEQRAAALAAAVQSQELLGRAAEASALDRRLMRAAWNHANGMASIHEFRLMAEHGERVQELIGDGDFI
jgi:hypothetical protein